MSEQQYHIVALSPLRNAFFDPVSRINLSRTNPQGFIPVGSPISGSIRAGLLGGGLVDKSGTLLPIILKEREETAKQQKAGFPRPPVGEKPAEDKSVPEEVKPSEEPIVSETPEPKEPEAIEAIEEPQAAPAEETAKPSSRKSRTK